MPCTQPVKKYPVNDLRYDGKIVNAQYSYSTWIRMFQETGFEVERLEEILISPEKRNYFDDLVDASWVSQWPCDIIWSVRKKST